MKAVWGAGTDLKRIWIGILGCEERGGEGGDSIHWDWVVNLVPTLAS